MVALKPLFTGKTPRDILRQMSTDLISSALQDIKKQYSHLIPLLSQILVIDVRQRISISKIITEI